MTDKQKMLLEDYTDGGESLWINNYLRGIHLQSLSKTDKTVLRRKARTLNKLIRNAPPSPHKMILFRSIAQGAPRHQVYHRFSEAEFLSKGIISTSVSYKAALEFIEEGEDCCMLVILVPGGTKMLQVLDASAWSEEKEVLLPHGQTFKIVKEARIKGVKTYYCVLVRQKA